MTGLAGLAGEPLTLALQRAIEPALARLRAGQGAQCLSDLSFANLYLFRAVHDYRYLAGAWPAISGRCYDGARHLIPLFDLTEIPWEALRALARGHDCLYPVARAQVQALSQMQDTRRFTVTESRADADYLYPASAFLDFSGRALAYKRSQLRRFQAMRVPSAQPFSPALESCAREVLSGWMAQKGKAEGSQQADETPCIEALAHAQTLCMKGFVHFDHARPIGFVLAEMLEPGVCVIRFAKGLDSYVGVYPYMFQHFCRSFESHFDRPVVWLNFEQDMGIPGLRRSKLSYQPAALLSKCRVAIGSQFAQDPHPSAA